MTDLRSSLPEGIRPTIYLDDLRAKAKALLDAVSHDDNGSMVAGHWVGGNGGLLSRDTIAAADALRLELGKWATK